MKLTLFSAGYCYPLHWFMDRSAPFRRVRVPVGVARLDHPMAGTVLIDTGLAPRNIENAGFLESLGHRLLGFETRADTTASHWLTQTGLNPADVGQILITHYHNDHIGGLRDFPNAQFVGSRTEYERIIRLSRQRQTAGAFNPDLLPPDFAERLLPVEDLPRVSRPELVPFTEVWEWLPDVFLVNLPGHTRNQFGVYLPTLPVPTFWLADAVWQLKTVNNQASTPPNIVQVIKDSWPIYQDTVQKLRTLRAAHPDWRLISSHDIPSFL